MKSSKSSLKYLAATSLLALGAAWSIGHSHAPKAVPVAQLEEAAPAAEAPAPAPEALAPAAPPKPIPSAAAAPPVKDVAAEKQALADPGEATRIAEREAKLDKLEWNAPRPSAPKAPEGPAPIGKREAAMDPKEKREETEIMITRLTERRSALEAQLKQAAAQGAPQTASDTFLLNRLEQRTAQLEETAHALHDKEQ